MLSSVHVRNPALADLLQKIRCVEDRHRAPDERRIDLGWDDRGAATLRAGCLHEWFQGAGQDRRRSGEELPAACLLTHLARRASISNPHQLTVWIGCRAWPHPHTLIECDDADQMNVALLTRSLWVDAREPHKRLWAIDLALRSGCTSAVIADGVGLDMAATRRLQLAAEAAGSLAILVRPEHDLSQLSAAATRWVARSVPSDDDHPRWSVELLRCKGMQPTSEAPRRWTVEWSRAKGLIALPSPLAGGTGLETGEPGWQAGRIRRTA